MSSSITNHRDFTGHEMVWSSGTDVENPPLAFILPHLYLGAESDVTQERLGSVGVSFVVSVSRCSVQPSFLPESSFLRIPIDDSLGADLLPWIPPALDFIDAAMSSGASVMVHCAAGISRSAALAVAYIMYHLDLDLDQAYRFVKERRPSISPNFNFLGQLQHFQTSLIQRGLVGGSPGSPSDFRMLPIANDANAANDSLSSGDPAAPLPVTGPPSPSGSYSMDNPQDQSESPLPGPPTPAEPQPTLDRVAAGSTSLSEKRRSLTLSLTPSSLNTVGHTHSESSHGRRRRAGEKEAAMMSPLSVTLNKLLGWGERLLLGGVFMPTVRLAQPALPYRC